MAWADVIIYWYRTNKSVSSSSSPNKLAAYQQIWSVSTGEVNLSKQNFPQFCFASVWMLWKPSNGKIQPHRILMFRVQFLRHFVTFLTANIYDLEVISPVSAFCLCSAAILIWFHMWVHICKWKPASNGGYDLPLTHRNQAKSLFYLLTCLTTEKLSCLSLLICPVRLH